MCIAVSKYQIEAGSVLKILPILPINRVDIWRDRCDRQSRKNLVNCVNEKENKTKRLIIHNQQTIDILNKCM